MDESTEWNYLETAMTETAAFIHYFSQGEASGGKGRIWDALTTEQKQSTCLRMSASMCAARRTGIIS